MNKENNKKKYPDSVMREKNGSIQICSYTGTVITDEKYISFLEKYISK